MNVPLLLRARRVLLVVGWTAVALAAQAGTLRGTVTHVTDGDTLWVRPERGGEPIEVRLRHLDAPEGCQAFGPQAKQALTQRVLRQPVVVRTAGLDDYRRVLGQVRYRGEDVGAWMVSQGHAWSVTYRGRPGPYAALEAEARRARRGLWAQARAQDPRTFRRSHGRCIP